MSDGDPIGSGGASTAAGGESNLTAARFVPGKSGNPGGRPKALRGFRKACRKAAPLILKRILEHATAAETPLPQRVEAFESVCRHGGFLPADKQGALDTGQARVLLIALAIKGLSDGQRDQLVAALAEATPKP